MNDAGWVLKTQALRSNTGDFQWAIFAPELSVELAVQLLKLSLTVNLVGVQVEGNHKLLPFVRFFFFYFKQRLTTVGLEGYC